MPAQITTRAQVNGYRFLIRRLEHSLIRADSRMIHDPMRGQMRALLVGMVVAVLICGAATVLAFMKPTPNFGNSAIMISKSSGQMLVRIGDRLHPVLNLASARLIAGKSDPPGQVDDKFLNSVPLGPMVGIVGAPTSIDGGDDMDTSSWAVCDSAQGSAPTGPDGAPSVQTTVLANDPALSAAMRVAAPEQMVLTTAGRTTFLIYEGVRAAIDPADPVISTALRLQGSEIRPISQDLLNAFPLVDPIVPVAIDGVGEPTTYLPAPYRVGSILETADSRGQQLYVALSNGLQPISTATADIIRYGNPQSPMDLHPAPVPPAMISGVPIAHTLPVDHYPSASPQFIRSDPDSVICLSWQRNGPASAATTRLLVGNHLPLPDGAQPVQLATADGSGPGLDNAYVKPGTGEYVQTTDADPASRAAGQLFYVSDLGVRYHIKDVPTATALGVVASKVPNDTTGVPQTAPWSIVSLLPPGPELSQQAALIAHDGMPADPYGGAVPPPQK